MDKKLDEITTATASDARFVWAGEEFLAGENVAPWSEMPLYLPESDAGLKGFLSANIDKALQTGLTFRRLSETIRETLGWRKTFGGELKAGLSEAREKDLLAKLREQF
jgi:2'-hydroxyisoflavone reductase